MSREPLPQVFYKLNKARFLQIIDSNIILERKSLETTNLFLGFIYSIILLFPGIIAMIILLINITFENDLGRGYLELFNSNKDMTFAFSILWFFVSIIFINGFFRIDTVIDRDKRNIYTVLNIFDLILIKFNKICSEDILEIGNNVTIYQGKNGGSRDIPIHPVTKYCHVYLISFLLKNGKILSIPFESDLNSYNNTVDLAKGLSDLWDLPLTICQDNCRLILNPTEASKNNYEFEMQEIKTFSMKADFIKLSKVLAIVFFSLITLFIFCYIIGTSNTKQGLTKDRVLKDIKEMFGIDLRKPIKTRKK